MTFEIRQCCPKLGIAIQLLPIMVAWLLLLPAVAAFTLPALPARVFQLRAAASSDGAGMRDKYLSRLGVDASIVDRAPNAEDLQALLTAHLQSIPFENLG